MTNGASGENILQNPRVGSSLKLVLEYYLAQGAEIKETIIDEHGSDTIVTVFYKGETIVLRSKNHYLSSVLNSMLGRSITRHKALTGRFLDLYGVPHPKTKPFQDLAAAETMLEEFGDVVVKPATGSHGLGVTTGVSSKEGLAAAVKDSLRISPQVILQQYVKAEDYRLLFVDYQLSAALLRHKPSVVGDGRHTIAELIDLENERRQSAEKLNGWRALHVFEMSAAEVERIHGRDFLNSVPSVSERVVLMDKANLSMGASSENITQSVNKDLIESCAGLLRLLGLGLCGIDVLSNDITSSVNDGKSWVIELNSAPGLMPHTQPDIGSPIDIGAIVGEAVYEKYRSASA